MEGHWPACMRASAKVEMEARSLILRENGPGSNETTSFTPTQLCVALVRADRPRPDISMDRIRMCLDACEIVFQRCELGVRVCGGMRGWQHEEIELRSMHLKAIDLLMMKGMRADDELRAIALSA